MIIQSKEKVEAAEEELDAEESKRKPARGKQSDSGHGNSQRPSRDKVDAKKTSQTKNFSSESKVMKSIKSKFQTMTAKLGSLNCSLGSSPDMA